MVAVETRPRLLFGGVRTPGLAHLLLEANIYSPILSKPLADAAKPLEHVLHPIRGLFPPG